MQKQNRSRCDGLPHENFIRKLTIEEVVGLMKEVISWKDDQNPHLREDGKIAVIKYTPYLDKQLNEIPYDIIEKLYGSLLIDDQGEVYKYDSCCN